MENVNININVTDDGIHIESEGSLMDLISGMALTVNMLSDKSGIPVRNIVAKLTSDAYDIELDKRMVQLQENVTEEPVDEPIEDNSEDISDEDCEIIPLEFWSTNNDENNEED